MTKKLIRFDWAIKKLLKDKANFDILEGFLSVLLKEQITIDKILDGESNKETEDDKYNRVDILVKDHKGEFIIIEVQNSKEYDRPATRYFHRMIYGTAKVISEYIRQGEPYANIKKVISVTIAYFDLGQGEDYVYHGTNKFYGIHSDDVLTLADRQRELYEKQTVHEIFPEYWIIKADKFDNEVKDKLDEWIYFLKNGEIKQEFTAPGLQEASVKLDELRMTEEERIEYKRYVKHIMDLASRKHTDEADYNKELEKREQKGREEGIEIVVNVYTLHKKNTSNEGIAETTGLSVEQVITIIKKFT